MKLAGKRAVVTGGSRGIGLATAKALRENGVRVMICGLRSAAVDQAIRASAADGEPLLGGACDVRDEASVLRFMQLAADTLGGIDILVNSAGVGIVGPVETFATEHWKATIETNLTGTFYCCRSAIPGMKARGGGDIVNIGSRSSVNAYAGGAAYCASKFGLLGFTESFNLEVRRDNIRVSCVMPGRVNTDFAGEAPQDWHLTSEDVAQAVIDILSFHPRALASRIELRPFNPAS